MIQSLIKPNPLTLIAAHQVQQQHHVFLSVVILITSSTLNMANNTTITCDCSVPKQSEKNNGVSEDMICWVIIVKKFYNTFTAVRLLPFGNAVALPRDQHDRHHGAIHEQDES